MSGLIDSATTIMSMAQRRLEVVAQNVANVSTPGYKRNLSFSEVLQEGSFRSIGKALRSGVRSDVTQGRLEVTNNPFDIAISGIGYFQVRHGDTILYSRQGQFRQTADGLFLTPQGYVLQQAGGGDLEADGDIAIAADGMVLVDGQPSARIAVMRTAAGMPMRSLGDSFFSVDPGATIEDASDVTLRSGMAEASNVDLGNEMTESMLALRQAESGARLIQLYDDLMGKAASAFGQGGGR